MELWAGLPPTATVPVPAAIDSNAAADAASGTAAASAEPCMRGDVRLDGLHVRRFPQHRVHMLHAGLGRRL